MSSFWLNAHDIRKYRALIISSMTAISVYVASAAISVNPANSPADAWQVILARAACSAVNPAFLAAIPRVKDTARYPSPTKKSWHTPLSSTSTKREM